MPLPNRGPGHHESRSSRSKLPDVDPRVERGLPRREREQVDSLVGDACPPRSQSVQPLPPIAHPDCPLGNLRSHASERAKLPTLVVQPDRDAIFDTAGGCVLGRNPEVGLWIRLGQRRQRAPMIVETVKLGQRAPLAKGQWIRRRRKISWTGRGGSPTACARSE